MREVTDTDYDEIVEGTVSEVKEKVEEEGLDPGKVLEAEREHKDRVTLVEWLEEKDAADSVDTAVAPATENSGGVFGAGNIRMLVAGLVLGIAAVLVALSLGVPVPGATGGLSPAAASERVETYFADNSGGLPIESVTVESAEVMDGSNLYRMETVLSAEFLNRTVEQNQTMIVDSNARYVFFPSPLSPIDTGRPLSDQMSPETGAPQG